VFTTMDTSVHQTRQGKLQTDLKTLVFHLVDMHRPSLNMAEDMEFERELSVNQILEICQVCRN
jgi:hypothetical protein